MEKIKIDYGKGKRVEAKFIEVLVGLGFKVIESTRLEDRKEGWDLKILDTPPNFEILKNTLHDVKGVKGDGFNWLELIAYTSEEGSRKLGWLLRGKAEFIVFERRFSITYN